MAVPSFLQSQTYSTNTASTTHQISLGRTVRGSGGPIGPSTLIATMSYDGTTGDIVSSITDNAGNTWQKGTSASNGLTTHGEMWYAYNAKPVNTTLTITLANSQKLSAVVCEVDQIRPVSPLDLTLARVDTTKSTARTSAATNSTKRQGQLEVVIAGIGWTHVTLNVSNAGSGFTQLVSVKDAGSSIGAAMCRRTTDLTNISGANSIGRFTMSATGTSPAAVMSLSFFRDGVSMSTSEDGYIDDIEGVSTVYGTDTLAFVYMSSTSAPFGGTGGSEKSKAYGFIPNIEPYLLAGVTINEDMIFNYSVSDGFDDGLGYVGAFLNVVSNGTFGSTLDLTDESYGGGHSIALTTDPTIAGFHTAILSKSLDYSPSNPTTWAMSFEGDTQGGATWTYSNLITYEGSVPSFIKFDLNYPGDAPQRSMTGAGL